jgi:hypothetical protein
MKRQKAGRRQPIRETLLRLGPASRERRVRRAIESFDVVDEARFDYLYECEGRGSYCSSNNRRFPRARLLLGSFFIFWRCVWFARPVFVGNAARDASSRRGVKND